MDLRDEWEDKQREAIREGRAPKPAPRFLVEAAGPTWANHAVLADHCEKSGLTEFQAEAALDCMEGKTYDEFAQRMGCAPARAKAAFSKVTDVLSRRLGFDAEKRRFWRDLLDCMRASEGARLPDPLVGLMPMVDTENHDTWADYLATLREPRNYRTVPLRGRIITPDDLCAIRA